MTRESIRLHTSPEVAASEFEKFFRDKFESNPPFTTTYDAWKAGYVQGMMKAAEIESEAHVRKGAKTRKS